MSPASMPRGHFSGGRSKNGRWQPEPTPSRAPGRISADPEKKRAPQSACVGLVGVEGSPPGHRPLDVGASYPRLRRGTGQLSSAQRAFLWVSDLYGRLAE